jgi:LacI family transcriptional regulator
MGSAKKNGGRRKQGEATLRDVALMAGVHPATVSRALSPATRHLVNVKTATRVDNAIRKLGYTPNPAARSLRTKRTATIGVVLYDLTNPLFPPIVVGVEDRLFGAGYASLLADSKASAPRARSAFETLSARQVDGFIMTTAALVDPLIEEMVEREIPVVAAVRTLGSGAAPAVVADDARGMRRAVEHLVELDHTQIVHIAGPPQISNGLRRRQAFVAAMTERGLPVSEDQVIEATSWSLEAGEDAFRSLFESSVEFTAVIAANDLIAIGGYAVLKSTAAGTSAPTVSKTMNCVSIVAVSPSTSTMWLLVVW